MIKRLLLLGTFLVLFATVKGQQIPKWKMKDVVKSFSANNDTTYVVNFWATFCKPCIEEIPDFIKITEKYKSKKVKLLLVSLDLPSFYPAKLAAFAKKNNYKTNIAWLNETNADIFCPMIDAKWSGAIPATIIVNNKTGYRKFAEDQISAEDFERYLNEAVSRTAMNKYPAPMNEAEISMIYNITVFKSPDSSVFAMTGGKVSTIVRLDSMKVVFIEKDGFIYCYSNLGSTFLKKGEEVKADQLIGYAAFDPVRYKPTVDIIISDTKGNYILLTKDNFIKRNDKRFTDHSIDFN